MARACYAAGKRRILLVSPTGSGKTVMASHMIQRANNKGHGVLFVAHRREIIMQTSEKLRAAEVNHGIVMAGCRPSAMATVHLGSIDTLNKRSYPENIGLVIMDEAHHDVAKTRLKLLEHYKDVPVLGLTATPCRGDGKGLGHVYEDMVVVATVPELIQGGYLVPVKAFAPYRPDLKGVHVKRGDYVISELSERLDKAKLIGDIVEHYERLGQGRKAIVFAVDIAHSLHIRDAFINAGIAAEHIDGETPHVQRKAIIQRHKDGITKVLCNVGVFTEGYDDPSVQCIILARSTKSFGLYLQMVGRGLRPYDGKENVLLLDHSGSVYHHGLPDSEVIWTLDTTEICHRRPKKKDPEKDGAWICGHCSFINKGRGPCGHCGLVKQSHRCTPLVGEGTLVEVKELKKKRVPLSFEDKEALWMRCLYTAARAKQGRGILIGAAANMYRDKTGVWPKGFQMMPRGKKEWNMNAREWLELEGSI